MIEAHSRYFAPYLGRMRPLPGAADLLGATARLGLHVVLATSAKDEEIDLMLDALDARGLDWHGGELRGRRRRSMPTRPTCSARSRLVLSVSLLSAPENRACYATRPAPWRRVTARHPTR